MEAWMMEIGSQACETSFMTEIKQLREIAPATKQLHGPLHLFKPHSWSHRCTSVDQLNGLSVMLADTTETLPSYAAHASRNSRPAP